ncbi:MAG: choice-of-anchor L domain-containing protein, partial [Bacteroidota bacterium]
MRFFTKTTLNAIVFTLLTLPALANSNYFFTDEDENLVIFDTMTVTERGQRFLFDIDREVGVLTLCRLNVGERYSIMLTPEETTKIPCVFELSFPNDKVQLERMKSENQVKQKLRYFTATETCMEFKINNANCAPDRKYEVWASVLCESCEKPVKPGYVPEAAPISISPGLSSLELIEDIFISGGCFEVTNVQPIGSGSGRGAFANGLTTVNMDNGVILASGDVTNGLGPNDSGSAGSPLGDSSGDQDLDLLGAGAAINDAVGIQFTVEPTVDEIVFEYAFASEEYCEFVGSPFNDVFGFFISGVGINGGFTGGAENIAVLPGTGTFVAINTVNHVTNSTFFNANSPSCNLPEVAPFDIQYDGYTTVLTAVANVVPCRQYNIRLVVADAGDQIYDSAVFLKANSFRAGGTASLDFNVLFNENTGAAYEGCSDGELIFERLGFDTSEPITLPVTISPLSTATEGVDYSFLPDEITIPAGETSVILPFTIFDDGLLEGQETLTVYIENTCECGG